MALEKYLAEMERCSACSYCKWVPYDQLKIWRFAKNCPSVACNNFNAYSARGRYSVGRSLLKGQSGYSETVRHIAFSCLNCGSRDVSCKICRYNLEPLEMARELKAKLVADGQGLSSHAVVLGSLTKEQNTMSRPKKQRGKWSDGFEAPTLGAGTTDVLFFAGCRLSFDEKLQQVPRAVVHLLRKANVNFAIMDEKEMCCGGRIFSMGYDDEFVRIAKSNIALWEKAGVKRIVISCSDCYHTFKRVYPQYGSTIEVVHTAEFIDSLLQGGSLKFTKKIPITLTYHDPCHLGRQGEPYVPWNGKERKIKNQIIVYEPKKPRYNGAWGVYEPPRNILKSIPGVELVEMERIREYSWCCGNGGGVREAYPDMSKWTARERIEEATTTGAQALVTACPWCERNFIDAIDENCETMKVYDIVELVSQAL
jgi:Fe-S oxidoreductase